MFVSSKLVLPVKSVAYESLICGDKRIQIWAARLHAVIVTGLR